MPTSVPTTVPAPEPGTAGSCTDVDLFCEDFESFTGTSAVSDAWSIESRAATASIDNTHAYGNKALHLTTNDNGMAFLVPKTFAPTGNSFYGRMRLWVDAFPTRPDYAHFTMVEASGSGNSTLVRPVGGQYIPGHANNIPLWGVGSDGGPTGDWTSWQDTTPTANGRWTCMEWQMDASDNAVNVWIDGVAKPELSVSTKVHGNGNGDFIFPNFNKIRLGWQLYQGGSTPPNFNIWLDDLALSSTRVGCDSNPVVPTPVPTVTPTQVPNQEPTPTPTPTPTATPNPNQQPTPTPTPTDTVRDPNNTTSGDHAIEWEDTYPVVTPVNNDKSVAGKFRIDAQGNITEDGKIFPVRCGNWFGLDGQQEPKNAENNADGAPMELYIGNMWWFNSSQGSGRSIDKDMQEIKAKGINMIRLPISPQTLDPTDPQGMGDASQKNGGSLKNHPDVQQTNALDGLEDFLRTADKYDVKVLLDVHSCSNYVGWRAGRIDAAPPWVDATREGYQFAREDWSCNAADIGKQVKLSDGRTVTMNVDEYNEEKWLADLQKIAQLPADLGIDNVIGIDIFNEPWDYNWDEWSTLAEKAYSAINSVNKDVLVFVEGTGDQSVYGANKELNPNWGENLYGFASDPLNIPQDRLVLSPHTYGPSVFVQPQFIDPAQNECAGLRGDEAAARDCKIVIDSQVLRKGWHQHFGFLRDQGYAVVVGEFGGNMDWPSSKVSSTIKNQWSHITTNVDEQWQHTFVNYMLDNNIHACYWSINPESADTYGWIKTRYDPIYASDLWGTWGDGNGDSIFDTRKTELLYKLWKMTP